ncbi:hypothetical protein [Actinokineospora fastidiosa]|uniref:Uncharacterized protein n=1 Tax=Actinokineospora fastidiosa TaxID=1816 RepID=A0A918G2E9_9PSEU|nr:hypothetical protein [Actinokineospora fastidiosa]GGS13513.1 hypothetical protein GCM10010171_01620 [Actinokineospora fastidiosa]
MTTDIDKTLRAFRTRISALEERRAVERAALPARLIAPAVAAAAVVLTALPWVTDRRETSTLWGLVDQHGGQPFALLAAVLALAATATAAACAEEVAAGAKAAAVVLGATVLGLLVWLGQVVDGDWWPAPWLVAASAPGLVVTVFRR